MAGRPRTQAKKLAQALRANGIDPDALLTAAPGATPGVEPLEPPPHARAHAHARGAQPGVQPLGRVPVGPETRRAIDARTVDDLTQLASQLHPGFTLRLERTRPYFAAGHVEDITIDDGDLGAQLDYIRAEHGGQVYRGTVLGLDGTPIFVARIPIAGPPRKYGRVMTRGYWDGSEDPIAPAPAAPVAAAPAAPAQSSMADTLQLFDHIHGLTRRGGEETLGAVREMVTTHQQQTRELLEALIERSPAGGKLGFKQQLAELAEATQAIEDIREVLGAPMGGAAPASDHAPQRSVLQGAFEQMAAGVMTQGLLNDQERARKRKQQQQQQPGAQRPAHFRRVQRRPPPKAPAG